MAGLRISVCLAGVAGAVCCGCARGPGPFDAEVADLVVRQVGESMLGSSAAACVSPILRAGRESGSAPGAYWVIIEVGEYRTTYYGMMIQGKTVSGFDGRIRGDQAFIASKIACLDRA